MEKKAISAPEKNADSPKQIRTAIKSIDGLTSSGVAEKGSSCVEDYKVLQTGFWGDWNQKILRGIHNKAKILIVNEMF